MQKAKTAANSLALRKARRLRRERYRCLSIVAFCMFAVLLALYLGSVFIQRHIDHQQDGLRDIYRGQTSYQPISFLFPSAYAEELSPEIPERFAELWDINPDLIGWLIAGDVVDEPVVYRDNEYYLNHSFYQSYSASGTVFADEENVEWAADRYVILYGHNMRNGSMFGKLNRYRKASYIREHPIVTFDTIVDETGKDYVPFAVFDASMMPEEQNYFYLRRFEVYQTGDETEIQIFLEELSERSTLNIPIETTAQDRILALVTCSYGDPDGRLMVFCRALHDDEAEEDIRTLMQQCTEK